MITKIIQELVMVGLLETELEEHTNDMGIVKNLSFLHPINNITTCKSNT